METKAEDIKRQRQVLLDQKRDIDSSAEEATREMAKLNSQSGRQELKLKHWSQDTFKAHRWVQENQDKFDNEVFGPVAVSCSVTDPKYADAIESFLHKNDFLAFTTQSKKDFRTLQRAFRENNFTDVSIKTCGASLDSQRAPFSNEELRRLGFDGWAKDFLRGPDPVIASLCVEKNLHQTPVALRDISEEAYNELYDAENGVINAWASGTHSYMITRRREYNDKSTRVGKIKPARWWTSQPVDVSLKQQYEQRIEKCNKEREQIEAKLHEGRKKMDKLREAHQKLEEEMVCRLSPGYGLRTYIVHRKRLTRRNMRSKANSQNIAHSPKKLVSSQPNQFVRQKRLTPCSPSRIQI